MTRIPTRRRIAVAAAALLCCLPATAAAPLAHTAGAVQAIAADGFKVAIADAGPRTGCPRISLADVRTGRTATLVGVHDPLHGVGTDYCISRGLSPFAAGHTLALANSTVYWSYVDGGNTLEQFIGTATPGRRARLLASDVAGFDWDVGPFVGPLFASGSTFAYAIYARDWLPPGCDPVIVNPGDTGCSGTSEPRRGSLHGPGVHAALPPAGGILGAVDSGRLAVLLHDGRVLVTTRAGRGLAVVTPPARPVAAAITGRRLAVLSRNRISVYALPGGRHLADWAAPAATSLDAEGRVAVYGTNGHRVVALNLRTGHRRLVVRHRRADLLPPQIEAGGIFYAYGDTVARIAARVP